MMKDNSLKVLGIVGARSGSKSIPHKNIKDLAGKPLMAWILETAKKSRYINRLLVSTDSEEYAEIARTYGAETPFLRPNEIAKDSSPEFEYILHALQWLKEHEGYTPDIIVRLMATVPLQEADDIDACVGELMGDPDIDSCVVIAEARQHPQKAMKIVTYPAGKKRLVSYMTGSSKDVVPLLRQGYEKAYFRANVIASRIKTIEAFNSFMGENVGCHVISQDRAVDIDSPVDFFITEKLMERFRDKKE